MTGPSLDLMKALRHGDLPPHRFRVSEISCTTVRIPMRDGTALATDIYMPPVARAPTIALRTPYGRSQDNHGFTGALLAFARRGYAVVSQDCRGTGESEPAAWDYYMYEPEDGYDLVEWITRQAWYEGFVGACGGSYAGQTQWCMGAHPAMSTIAPSVSGLGLAVNTAHLYMFLNAYARAIGKGSEKVSVAITEMERLFETETLEGGYFNEPLHRPFRPALLDRFPHLRNSTHAEAKRWLWNHYCSVGCSRRAELIKIALGVPNVTSMDVESLASLFGHTISHDRHTLPHTDAASLCRAIHAAPLIRTGWYDWALNDALATWEHIRREGRPEVARQARLVIAPHAHNMPGYREAAGYDAELMRPPGLFNSVGLLLQWYASVREGTTGSWPTVMYYLMGANEWCAASDWPVPQAVPKTLYLGERGTLTLEPSQGRSYPDCYTYDPRDPTPTVGGSIVSYVYTPGSVDVSRVQQRSDVLTYTSAPLASDIDVVGPLKMILYASSSAVDTDFVARLSDVLPDGRALQLQNGILRARFRNSDGEPELLEPGRIYRLEIDMWATANRFRKGHRIRVDVSSADFPRFDRNSNLGGGPGAPVPAVQTIYRDAKRASHVLLAVMTQGDELPW
jgi:uncharacterized protein